MRSHSCAGASNTLWGGDSSHKPRLLFEGQFRVGPIGGRAEYDVTSDGQRFLMIQESGAQSAPRQLEVVMEWFSELKRAGGK